MKISTFVSTQQEIVLKEKLNGINLVVIYFSYTKKNRRAPVAHLVEHRAVTREVMSSTPARPTLRVFK